MDDRLGIDWLLDCEPRPAQIEALARSYKGEIWRNHKDDPYPVSPVLLDHAGRPARGWGHFMEMRVGKTPVALNEFLMFKRDHGLKKCFMLSPNKYKYTWELEALRFGIDVPLYVFETKQRVAAAKWMNENSDEGMIFVNYEALIQDQNCTLFANWIDDRTYMGADESVMLKNSNSTFFEKANLLQKPAAVTRPMTGLPNPQGPADLWAQLRFARKLNGYDYYPFRGRFSEMKAGYKGKKKVVGIRNEEELRTLLDTMTFRARRRDWGTKIDSDYEEVSLDMLPPQRRAYNDMEEEFITFLEDGDTVTADQVITKRMKMQQISSGFIIDEEGKPREIVPFHRTPKFLDLLDRIKNQLPLANKLIIVAHYTHTIKMLLEHLAEFKPTAIFGQQHMKKLGLTADSEKNRFNDDPKTRIMVAQSQAVKYGHTLMGTQENPCIDINFFENNYSLDNRAQVEERPQGEGQIDAIHIWDYFSSPVERDIVRALQTKQSISDAILNFYGKS